LAGRALGETMAVLMVSGNALNSLPGKISRFLSDVLVGVPSIVLGYFGYIVMVIGFGWKFSLLAGVITLAILMLPYIARTSEMALRPVVAPQMAALIFVVKIMNLSFR
jgi:ABC-type phosphate transport system permease subunit